MSHGPRTPSGRIARGSLHAEAAAVHGGGADAVASGWLLLADVRAAVAAG